MQWLNQFEHPFLPPLWVEKIAISETKKTLQINIPFACNGLAQKLREWMSANPYGNDKREISVKQSVMAMATQQPQLHTGIKNILLVSSAKGGVGKSTTAVNIALALSLEGAKVGLLDADIYGPSVPHLLGTQEKFPQSPDNKHMHPVEKFGIYSHSIGYLVPNQDAAVWRGPMASKALQQIIDETLWPELDYLIVDMPPGTGDIQLTIAQKAPVTAALVVTTPQDLALIDAQKGVAMFEKLNIPVVGLVENMSVHVCSKCGHAEHIFGALGTTELANKHNISLLAQLPLDIAIRQDCDDSTPTVINRPEHPVTQQYRELAGNIASKLFFDGEPAPQPITVKNIVN